MIRTSATLPLVVFTAFVDAYFLASPLRPNCRLLLGKQRSSTAAASDEAALYLAKAQQLRHEAATLERELAANAEAELDAFFAWADVRHEGKVDSTGLRLALQHTLVDENWSATDAAKAQRLIAPLERVERLVALRDSTGDGFLRRRDIASVSTLRTELERLARAERMPQPRRPKHDQKVGSEARLAAVACYLVPALEAASPYALLEVPIVASAVVAASRAYKALAPLGFFAFLFLIFVAFGLTTPKPVRVAASNACVLDLFAGFALPFLFRHSQHPLFLLVPTLFEFFVFLSALAAALGRDTSFLPMANAIARRFHVAVQTHGENAPGTRSHQQQNESRPSSQRDDECDSKAPSG